MPAKSLSNCRSMYSMTASCTVSWLPWLRTFLQLKEGIASHDTFGRVFSLLDPAELAGCIQQWLHEIGRELGQHLAIDGKTLRGSFDKAAGRNPLHLVSA